MKRILLPLFDLLTWPFAHGGWPALNRRWRSLYSMLYAAYLQHQMGSCKRLIVIGSGVHVSGMKYMEIGKDVEFSHDARIDCVDHWANTNQHFKPRLVLHDGVVVQAYCHIGCLNHIEIGEHTTMGARCYITDHTHGSTSRADLLVPPRHRPLYSRGPVKIGKNVHLGEGVCVMPGVTIGDYSVIGAGSVVTRDIPPFSIAVGSPARVVKTIDA